MEHPLYYVVGGNTRRLRREHRLSQEGLAKRIGCHRTFISEIERGTRTDIMLRTLGDLAQGFGVEPEELLRRER